MGLKLRLRSLAVGAGRSACLAWHAYMLCFDAADQVDHFNRAFRAFAALVSCLGSGAFDGLLNVFGGQHAKHNRKILV